MRGKVEWRGGGLLKIASEKERRRRMCQEKGRKEAVGEIHLLETTERPRGAVT